MGHHGTISRTTLVIGNPRPGSRTRAVAEELARALVSQTGRHDATTHVIDLAEHASELVDASGGHRDRYAIPADVEVVIVATPVYKSSFTGLLKLFLDQLPPGGLARVVAVPVSVSASLAHKLVADLHLRPVLAELGASLPVPSLLVEEAELGAVPELAREWAGRYAPVVAATVAALRQPAEATAV
ncbi:NADPH-dependent FMN reductase [Micromonospora cathayae]|uniref:NAD(P)H-dependent oxidoreductase n=1 Tax=Micromonospora cathayae TaxID=3028804 RepID=A0ABY7ZPW5_9ACTN|nr:NAD(P)H-dependent oxidoreductase [Micromonospora sp. HUAS 3]WDZ85070.1 NAD(P)H-dependent oxidoreductase [Micromonospora sp. HUAS 3]